MKIKLFSCLTFLLFSFYSFPQNADEFFKAHQSEPIQKIYLTTDRQFYFLGDTLWFAAFLMDGNTHVPVAGNSNLYVELINDEGEIIQNRIFTMFDGFGQGYLSFERNQLNEGKYLLRSYNDYLRNFGEDYFFCKNLNISKSKNSAKSVIQTESGSKDKNINIDFYPEGGFFLVGQVNQVAFKVTGFKEEESDISGIVVDETGKELARFSTLYNGMGKLFFVPESNTNYKVKLEGITDQVWKLPEVHNEGAKIVATLIDSAFVNLSIVHSESVAERNFHIAVLNRGRGNLFINVDATRLDKMIRLTNDYFGNGINRVILLNEDYEPVSERLIFRDKLQSLDLQLVLNKNTFNTRDKVVIDINGTDELEYDDNAGLSVVVVNSDALNAKGVTQNIKSYLLIDSELKGMVPDPADFFKDSEKVKSRLKQDLLMLTQGWSNYIWNDLENKKIEIDSAGFGLTFRGKLLDSKKKTVVPNSDVFLRLNSKTRSNLLFSSTDDQGNFEFQKVFFTDTAFYNIQGNTSKGRLGATVELKPLIDSPEINPDVLNSVKGFEDIPLSLYRLNFLNEQALDEFYPDRNTRVLKEIKVTGTEAKEDDGHYRIYNKPMISLTVTEKDLTYQNIFQYLQGRAPGVQVYRDRIVIHGFSSLGGSGVDIANEPLYLLDGIAIDKSMLSSIKMSSIDKIEVLKGNEAAMFGSRGSTGVISILSKSSGNFGLNMGELPAGVYEKIMGYSPFREFYSPDYEGDNSQSKTPDYRTTLYWNPEVLLIDGKAEISLFTSDNLSEYKIFVEGITYNGKVCLGQGEFVVGLVPGVDQ